MVAGVVQRRVKPVHGKSVDSIITTNIGFSHLNFVSNISTELRSTLSTRVTIINNVYIESITINITSSQVAQHSVLRMLSIKC